MAWASVWCKSQSPRDASRRHALPRIASSRTATQRGLHTGAPLHPSTQPQAVWWVDTCHRLHASPRLAPHRCASRRNPTGPPAHPHHPLQAHEPSGCRHSSKPLRTAPCRRAPQPRRHSQQSNGGGQPPHTPPLSLWLSGGLTSVHRPLRRHAAHCSPSGLHTNNVRQ